LVIEESITAFKWI